MSEQVCIIAGASHAGAQLAGSLRQEGWSGRIVLVGDEPWLPYNRPPLSKTFLAGSKTIDDILIRPQHSYDRADIECRLGRKVTALDTSAGLVRLDDGEELAYHRLALTVGARVRTLSLPGSDLPGIFYLRTIGDVQAIHQYTGKGKRAVIVGGGYIGLETAAMLRQTGMQVTVLEMAERILGRVTAPEVAGFFSRIHREEGVEIITGAQVTGFSGKGRVMAVACGDQQNLEADLVIIGIGIIPNVELAQQAGLKVDDGILVNEHCQTSASDIVAAGDCTRHFNSLFQRSLRLESVQNAVEQARVAAATVCGKTKEYNALPWFWSDQYDMKLQIAGLSMDYDELVIRGDVGKGRSFAAFYLKNNVLIAVDAVNRPQEFLLGKQLITAQVEPDKVKLGDTDIPMKEIVSGSLK